MSAVQQPQTRHQLWATFSVKDHCRRGAFIAEVLLYDKLLIPVLPTTKDGLSKEQADNELVRWKKSDWKPQRQSDILDVLKDRAEQIPWTAERQAEWQDEMVQSFAEARRNGYFKTGTVLQRFAPAMARTIVAVSPVYSLAELRKMNGIRPVTPRIRLPQGAVLAVMGQELLVPSPSDGGYLPALAQAVKVAATDEYRAARQVLYDWQHRFCDQEMTDAASIEAAVNDMKGLVSKLRSARKEQKKWRSTKNAFSFFSIVFKAAELVEPVSAKVGGAFASLGTFAADMRKDAPPVDDPAIPAATMILSARETLRIP